MYVKFRKAILPTMKKKFFIAVTVVYSLIAVYFVFLYGIRPIPHPYTILELITHRTNLIPFKSMYEYLHHAGHYNLSYILKFFLGNTAILFPIGMVTAYFSDFSPKTVQQCCIIGAIIAFIIESVQILLRIGSFDIDCIILRTLGMILGGLTAKFIFHFYQMMCKKNQNI